MVTEAVSEGACAFPPITLWLPRAPAAGAGLGHSGLEQGFQRGKEGLGMERREMTHHPHHVSQVLSQPLSRKHPPWPGMC